MNSNASAQAFINSLRASSPPKHYIHSAAAKLYRQQESEKIQDLSLLELALPYGPGRFFKVDALKLVFPGVRPSRFTKTQTEIVLLALSRLCRDGLLCGYGLLCPAPGGGEVLKSVFCLTDAGRHKLMTRSTRGAAYDALAEIDSESSS